VAALAVADITQAETHRRARLLTVRSYDVDLDLTRGESVFASRTVIRFDCAEPGEQVHADLIAVAVHAVELNGQAVDPQLVYADGRIALPALAASNELVVRADCAYTTSGTGLHRSTDSADGRVYIYAKFEPAYARSMFTTFEQPDLKAPVRFSVTVPAQWTVLSNQPAKDTEQAADGRTTWRFPPTEPLPTYNATVVAGEYHVVRDEHVTPAGQRLPLELACRTSLAADLDAAAIFTITRQGLDYFTGLFGTPYPFAKYGQAFVPEFSAGATEDAGCVLVSEQFLFRGPATAAQHEVRAMVILHEMAHMWFGDLVTMRWWDDLWLNESFAEFCGHLATAEATSYTGAWSTFCVGRKTWGLTVDRLPSTHPVASSAPTLSDAIANFDGISYAKGAAVLRQLAAAAGRDAFFAAVGDYLRAFRFGNASRRDFLQAVARRTGMDIDEWSRAWLETTGPSTLRCQMAAAEDGRFTSFAVEQELPAGDQVSRPLVAEVGLYQRAGDKLARVRRVAVGLSGRRTTVPDLVGQAWPDLVLPNDGDLAYAAVRLDPRSLRTITESLGDLDDPLARAVCWAVIADMVEQAELPVPVFVSTLAREFAREPSVAMLEALTTHAEQMMTRLADPGWVPEGKRLLATAAATTLRVAEPGGDHQSAAARLLAWTAATPDQLTLAASLLDGEGTAPGLAVTADLRWTVLQRLVATGHAGQDRIETELAADATDAGRRGAAACRAAIADREHKQMAWDLLVAGQAGVETMIAVARGFALPEHASLLAPFAGRYIATMRQVWNLGSTHLRVLLGILLLPYPAASAELLARLDEALATDAAESGLARVFAERADEVRRALASRALTSRAFASPVQQAPGTA
jgi:aminopeptidase N